VRARERLQSLLAAAGAARENDIVSALVEAVSQMVVHERSRRRAGGGARWRLRGRGLQAALADRPHDRPLALGFDVLVPLYGLAPDHDGAATLAFTTSLVDDLAGQGRAIPLSGGSSGGGLPLLTAQNASPSGRAALRGLGLMAPWVDLTPANPEIEPVERGDPWLARAALHELARTWAASWDVSDPRVSPISGDFEGLPPVDLWVGDRDTCMPDSRRLVTSLRSRSRHTERFWRPLGPRSFGQGSPEDVRHTRRARVGLVSSLPER
jgi:acetyl esterase/lipase